MLGQLLKRFWGNRKGARPVSPPPPPVQSIHPSSPPPPPPAAPAPPAVVEGAQQQPLADAEAARPDRRRVRVILEDGTMTEPSLDPDLEERLRYIVDNIVPPSSPPTT